MKGLTERQKEILEFVDRRKNRRPAWLWTVPMDGPGAVFRDGRRDEIFCDARMLGEDPASDVKELFARQIRGNVLRNTGYSMARDEVKISFFSS